MNPTHSGRIAQAIEKAVAATGGPVNAHNHDVLEQLLALLETRDERLAILEYDIERLTTAMLSREELELCFGCGDLVPLDDVVYEDMHPRCSACRQRLEETYWSDREQRSTGEFFPSLDMARYWRDRS